MKVCTGALGHVPGPGAVDSAVAGEKAVGVVAVSAGVGDGAGEGQALVDQDLGVLWSFWVPT